MISFRNLKPYHVYSLLKHQNTSLSVQIPPHSFPAIHECVSRVSSFFPSWYFQRTLSITTQLVTSDVTQERIETSESTELVKNKEKENVKKKKKEKKPLDVMFKEAVGLIEKQEESDTSDEESEEGGINGDSSWKEIHELKKKLRNLEREVRSLKGVVKVTEKKKNTKRKKKQVSIIEEQIPIQVSKPNRLSSLFTSNPAKVHSALVKNSGTQKKPDTSKREHVRCSVTLKPFEELSPDIELLVNRLHEDGYLKDANFLPPNKLDMSYFSSHYSRDFLRCAAERFGQDHQEIIKRLSHDDLKRVALFGCPTAEKKTAFATKRLRSFFDIQEDIVCRPCQLRSSCKVVNQRTWKKADELSLADVMRVLTLYALEMVPEQLELPSEIKDSVSKLLNEVVNPQSIMSCSLEDPSLGVSVFPLLPN